VVIDIRFNAGEEKHEPHYYQKAGVRRKQQY
jgi:hypothetical protein